jgi:hypothetical protein
MVKVLRVKRSCSNRHDRGGVEAKGIESHKLALHEFRHLAR